MFLKNSYVVETLRPHRLPLSVRRVLQRKQSILRCFENSQNVKMNSNISAAELNWRGQSALLAGIVLAGLFVYLFQTHPFEEFALNLEVIAITLGKVTEKAARSAIAQGVDQRPNTVIYKISFAPNLCHNDCPRFV